MVKRLILGALLLAAASANAAEGEDYIQLRIDLPSRTLSASLPATWEFSEILAASAVVRVYGDLDSAQLLSLPFSGAELSDEAGRQVQSPLPVELPRALLVVEASVLARSMRECRPGDDHGDYESTLEEKVTVYVDNRNGTAEEISARDLRDLTQPREPIRRMWQGQVQVAEESAGEVEESTKEELNAIVRAPVSEPAFSPSRESLHLFDDGGE